MAKIINPTIYWVQNARHTLRMQNADAMMINVLAVCNSNMYILCTATKS